MLKKTIRRLGALAMVLAMAVSVFAVNASAADKEVVAKKDVTISKTVSASNKVLTKAETYNFTISAGDAVTATASTPEIYAGDLGALNSTTPSISLAEGVKTGTTTITITASEFDKPGVYRYLVAENAGSTDGMTYYNNAKTMDVYVEQVDGMKSIAAVVVDGETNPNTKSNLDFTNVYATHNLTVSKKIEGNQANMDGSWDMIITITGQEGDVFATSVTDRVLRVEKQKDNSYQVTTTVSLGDGDSFIIYGLSAGDNYSVTEDKANTDGYVTAVTVNNVSKNAVEQTGNTKEGDVTVAYTNTKQVTTPGGVIMTIAPYALMVVLAGAFAVVFLTRRNRAE